VRERESEREARSSTMSTSICGKWTQETPFSNMEAILDTVGESHTV